MSVRYLYRFVLAIVAIVCLPAAQATVLMAVRGVVHDPESSPDCGRDRYPARCRFRFSGRRKDQCQWRVHLLCGSSRGLHHQRGPVRFQHAKRNHYGSFEYLAGLALRARGGRGTAVSHGRRGHSQTNVDSFTPTTMVSREDIAHTPGASRTNSMAMITDYVPGAYMTHDMLHMRGGHELSWMIDGVNIPNTNIASNVAPQIDPKDINYLEVDRGSYQSSLGDRTYGIFDVSPRTGFERNRQGELVLSAGNFYQTNDQLSLGDHSQKFAWYTSLNGNRSNYGLQPAIETPIHDASNGYGGFASLIYNHDPANQLRLVTQARADYYQIPYDPDPDSWQNQLYDSSGLRDGEHETDAYAAFTWVHNFNTSTLLQVSPFYHYNDAKYDPSAEDLPTATTSNQTGNYGGVQASIATLVAKNALSAGFYAYGQHEHDVFGVVFNDGSFPDFTQPEQVSGGVEEFYAEDTYKPTTWLTLIGGFRQSNFQGDFSESAMYPRVGAAVMIPKLKWVFRGFYGRFLSTTTLDHYFRASPAVCDWQRHQLRCLKGRAG